MIMTGTGVTGRKQVGKNHDLHTGDISAESPARCCVGERAADKEKIIFRGFEKNTGLGLALSCEIFAITETGEPGKGARFEMVVPKGMYR